MAPKIFRIWTHVYIRRHHHRHHLRIYSAPIQKVHKCITIASGKHKIIIIITWEA